MMRKTMPKVSVIVPVYRVEKYIERCVRSLFEQTLDDIEYLFIDDCTPDKSIDILNQVLEEYPYRKPQVIVHRMERNSGQAAVRKWGIQNATGEYLIHCDSDDWIDKGLYEKMYEKATKEHADVAVCDYRETDGEVILREVKGCGSNDCEVFFIRQLLQKDSWSLWNKMFLRTVCCKNIEYPTENMGEDMVLTIQQMYNCKNVAYIQNYYYYYYINKDSISNKKDRSLHIVNFERLKSNTDMLIRFLENKKMPYKKWIINGLHYNASITLLNVIHSEKKYRDMWRNAYPGTQWRYIVNPYMRFDRRFKCLLALIGIYPFKKDRI